MHGSCVPHWSSNVKRRALAAPKWPWQPYAVPRAARSVQEGLNKLPGPTSCDLHIFTYTLK